MSDNNAAAPKADHVSEPYKFEDEVKWLREAARYFSSRDTGGEDRAHWANVYNAENANKIADRLAELMNTHPAPASDELLEAIAEECRRGGAGTATQALGALSNVEALVCEYIAKHKGPQS